MKKTLYLLLIIFTFSFGISYADFPAVEVYKETSNSVVFILAKDKGRAPMVGAGSIISKSGEIITNAHIVINKEEMKPFANIKVYFKPDKVTGSHKNDLVNMHKAHVTAFDYDIDIALIKVDGLPSTSGIIELASPDEVRIGEEVVAIGHPEQGGFWTLTYGRISGEILNQHDISGKDVYQTDTSVNRGNSGGPLLDRRGYMVGINTNIARMGAGHMPITGVNFALKSSVVTKWLSEQGILIYYGSKPLHKDVQVAEASKDKGKSKEKILTPKRPYKIDDLFKEAEKDLESLMDEMRNKIK